MNLSENRENKSDSRASKLLDYLLYSDPPTHHRTPCKNDLRPVLQSLQSVPESPQFGSLRKCGSRLHSPGQKGTEDESWLSIPTSPTKQNKARADSLGKQLALWKERAQVWGKEKREMQKRLEKVKNTQVLATQNLTNSEKKETEMRKITREIEGKRQEMKISEQEKVIEELREEVAHIKARDTSELQELTLKQEIEKWRKTTGLLRSELSSLKTAYQSLETAYESLISEAAKSSSSAITKSQLISVLQSQLTEAKVSYQDLSRKYVTLASAKPVQNEGSGSDLIGRKTNEELGQRFVSLQKRYNEALGYFETDLAEKQRTISELLDKVEATGIDKCRLERDLSELRTEHALLRLKSQVKDVDRNKKRLSNCEVTN